MQHAYSVSSCCVGYRRFLKHRHWSWFWGPHYPKRGGWHGAGSPQHGRENAREQVGVCGREERQAGGEDEHGCLKGTVSDESLYYSILSLLNSRISLNLITRILQESLLVVFYRGFSFSIFEKTHSEEKTRGIYHNVNGSYRCSFYI